MILNIFFFLCGYPAVKILIYKRPCKQMVQSPKGHLDCQSPTNSAYYFPTTRQALRMSVWCSKASQLVTVQKRLKRVELWGLQKDALGTHSEHRTSNSCSPGSRRWLGPVFCWCSLWCIVKMCISQTQRITTNALKKPPYPSVPSCLGAHLHCLWFLKLLSTFSTYLLGSALQQLHLQMGFPPLHTLIDGFVCRPYYHNANKEQKWCSMYPGRGEKCRSFSPAGKASLWVRQRDRLYITLYFI